MKYLLTFSFIVSLCTYLGIAAKDIRLHYQLDGTPTAIPFAETVLHCMAGTLVATILSFLIFGDSLSLSSPLRSTVLSIAPVILTAVGMVDEFFYHLPRCKNDPKENWYHAVLHFSMGSTIMLGYARWY